MMPDRAHVDRLFGAPELTRLIDRLARRIEQGRPLVGSLTLTALEEGERAAVAAIYGRTPGAGSSMAVDLDRLDEIVRDSGAASSLTAAVEYLRGPLLVRPAHAEAQQRAWNAAYAMLDAFVAERPEHAQWAAWIRQRGIVRRRSGTPEAAQSLLDRVVAVLLELPVEGEALPRFAARVLGSAHALDLGTPEGTLVLSSLRHGEAVTGGARQRRELWASVGVAVDELSSTVLVHRLPLSGPLGELTHAGEPVVVTLRQLRGLVVPVPSAPVFVCENPSVVDAAARELGDAGAPLVCVQGQPSIAADVLLRKIASAGIRYHGDFDWGGVRIANRLHELFEFEPWRYRATDLECASDLPGEPLKGTPIDADWDPNLRAVLQHRGTRLEEEQLLDVLVGDLSVA